MKVIMGKPISLIRALSALLCVLGAFAAGPARADDSVSALGMGMGTGPNKPMKAFDAVIAQYNASGKRFRIDGHCQSACTMFLSIKNVCVEPDAELLFHAGTDRSGQVSAKWTKHMLDTYKPALAKYLIDNHLIDGIKFYTISGSVLISQYGYPAC
jgi:hypothetical protein